MEFELVKILLWSVSISVFIASIITLCIVYRIYKMHNVRNKDGVYSWIIPDSWIDFQSNMLESQERIVNTISESSVNHVRTGKLLESLTNATLALHQSINGDKNVSK